MKFTPFEEEQILQRSGLMPRVISADIMDNLRKRYDDGTRYYHTWDHALSVLAWSNHVFDVCQRRETSPYVLEDFAVASLFHDVVYTSEGAPKNEEASVRVMKGWLQIDTKYAASLILATAKHGQLESDDVPLAVQLFLDCDIASLGEPRWEVVLWNEENIVAEYRQWHSAEQVTEGRRAFLKKMLTKRTIFLSEYFQDLGFERYARRNIKRLLQELG